MRSIPFMNRLLVCALLLAGTTASATSALERRAAIRKANAEAAAAAEAKKAAEEAERAARAPQALLDAMDQRIEAAQRTPGDARRVLEVTQALRDLLRDNPDPRVHEGALVRVPAVEALADQAIATNPHEAPLLLMEKASLVFNAGRKGEVEALVHASMDARPNLDAALALMGIHARRGAKDQVPALCQRTRPQLFREPQVWMLLDACRKHAPTPEAGLAWASPEDKDFYFREANRRATAPVP